MRHSQVCCLAHHLINARSCDFAPKPILLTVELNLFRNIRLEPWIDRRGRLRGNLVAGGHIARCEIEPEFALNIVNNRPARFRLSLVH